MVFGAMPRAARVLVALGTVGLGACGSTFPNISVASPGKIEAAPDAVTVVVIQPTSRLRAVELLEGHGQLVGQLDERSHTVLRLHEGPTVLYAVLGPDPSTVDRIEGTLIAGRVYYAIVEARAGGVALLALTARSRDWKRKGEYLTSTPRLQIDPQRLTRAVNELGDTDAIIQAGDARAAKLDAAQVAAHSIQETDGF
ncbi:MAG: hypothetical protein JWM82_2476 [Myxococcales bacterium]|nr:hypothetical protein [Myxococcales bacterium]